MVGKTFLEFIIHMDEPQRIKMPNATFDALEKVAAVFYWRLMDVSCLYAASRVCVCFDILPARSMSLKEHAYGKTAIKDVLGIIADVVVITTQ